MIMCTCAHVHINDSRCCWLLSCAGIGDGDGASVGGNTAPLAIGSSPLPGREDVGKIEEGACSSPVASGDDEPGFDLFPKEPADTQLAPLKLISAG